MSAPVRIEVTHADGKRKKRVEAWPTCSPHFVVTRHIRSWNEKGKLKFWRGWYQVTHRESGAQAIPTGVKGRRQAQLYAAILSGFPIAWSKLTSKNCHRILAAEAYKYQCMEPWMRAVTLWSLDCYYGEVR